MTARKLVESLFRFKGLRVVGLFLAEIRRTLKSDGLAVISVPNRAAWINRVCREVPPPGIHPLRAYSRLTPWMSVI